MIGWRHGLFRRLVIVGVAITGLLGLWMVGQARAQQTAAGTLISAQSTIDYQDLVGNSFSVQSNVQTIRVGQVYAYRAEAERDRDAPAGANTTTWMILTNTGNGPQTFDIGLTTGIAGGSGGQSFTVDNVINGSADAGAQANTAIASATGTSYSPSDFISVTINAGASVEAIVTQTMHTTVGIDQSFHWVVIPRNASGMVEGVGEIMSDHNWTANDTGSVNYTDAAPGAGTASVASRLIGIPTTVLTASTDAVITAAAIPQWALDEYNAGAAFDEAGRTALTNLGYPGFVRVTSATTGASDVIYFENIVNSAEDIVVEANRSGQMNAGNILTYDHVIRNNGNTVEQVELIGAADTTGWTAMAFVDTDADGVIDDSWLNISPSGNVTKANAAGTLMVVPLVAGAVTLEPGDAIQAGLRVASPANAAAGDPAATLQTDSSTMQLGEIMSPTVSIQPPGGGAPYSYTDGNPSQRDGGLPGDTVTFTFDVSNDSAVPQSFYLNAGGSNIGGSIGALPPGWIVVFRDPDGNVITGTPNIPPGSNFTVTAEVIIPTDMENALADHTYGSPIDDSGTTSLPGGDTDGDYGIFFEVTSPATGASAQILANVDVGDLEDLVLSSNQAGQVKAGNAVDYPHSLENAGNTVELVSFFTTVTNTGWTSVVMVDTDLDGTAETAWSALGATDSIGILDTTGNLIGRNLAAGEISLSPGETVPLNHRVFAESGASPGTIEQTTLTAPYNAAGTPASVTNRDTTTVADGQLEMEKTAALDANCDGTPDGGFTLTATRVAPAECVIWQVVATNTGVDPLTNLVVNDRIPAYTTYSANSLAGCAGDAGTGATAGCTYQPLTNASEGGAIVGGNPVYQVTSGSVFALPNSELAPGASVSLRFSVVVD